MALMFWLKEKIFFNLRKSNGNVKAELGNKRMEKGACAESVREKRHIPKKISQILLGTLYHIHA